MEKTRGFLAATLVLFVCRVNSQSLPEDGRSLERIVERAEKIRGYRESSFTRDELIDGKCGLRFSIFVHENWDRFSDAQKKKLQVFLAPPQMQKDRVIGRFHILYDTTGANAPSLLDSDYNPIPGTVEPYVDSVGEIFNFSWNFNFNTKT